jgi:sulfite oxidase
MGLWDKREDMIIHEADPYNAEPVPSALADRMLTPLDSFYGRNHGPIPVIDPRAWRLRIDGLAEQHPDLSLDDLRSQFPRQTLTATLQCAGNRRAGLIEVRDIPGEAPWGPGATSTAQWTGVSLAAVLRAAGPSEEAAHVAFSAPDISQLADPPQAYGASITLAKAIAGEVLLAWAMNGQPLPPVHGAPVRVIVPGYIGARSVKWVERITLQDHPSDNYFQATAYRLLPAEADPAAAGPGDGLSLGAIAVNSASCAPQAEASWPSVPPGSPDTRLPATTAASPESTSPPTPARPGSRPVSARTRAPGPGGRPPSTSRPGTLRSSPAPGTPLPPPSPNPPPTSGTPRDTSTTPGPACT